jgi:hypothetical protein
MSDEIKKDGQVPEVKTEPSGEPLPESELAKAVGGVRLSFGGLGIEYKPQKADGAVEPNSPPPAK